MSSLTEKRPVFWWQRTAKLIYEAPLSLSKALMVGLSLFTTSMIVAEVMFRHFVKSPQLWVEELTVWVVMWFYFAGGIYATYKRRHIECGAVHMIFKNKPKALTGFRIAAVLISLALSGLMVLLAYNQFTYSLQVNPKTIHLLLPWAYSRLALLVGFALMIVYFIVELVALIRGWPAPQKI